MDGQLFNCDGKTYNTASLPKWARELIASLVRQREELGRRVVRAEDREYQARQQADAAEEALEDLADAEPHATCNCSGCAAVRAAIRA
jgi:hypothetical protein